MERVKNYLASAILPTTHRCFRSTRRHTKYNGFKGGFSQPNFLYYNLVLLKFQSFVRLRILIIKNYYHYSTFIRILYFQR